MFRWQPRMIGFLRDASEQGAYHGALAERLVRHLPRDGHVCDAGCGLGYLSLALARHCRQVSAVDIAPEALAVLRENILRRGVKNIRTVEGDIAACPPNEPYAAMVFCFFGRTAEALALAHAQCRGKVLLVKRNWAAHRFTLAETPVRGFTLARTRLELRDMGIPHQLEEFSLEMGQPFRSLEDAAAFFRLYSRESAPADISAEEVRARLVPGNCGEFPYYLPSTSRLGLITLDVGDIPHSIETLQRKTGG